MVESGGDNLTAVFSRELADRFIFVIDVAEGDKIPRKGGPGICTSDLLVINKTDLCRTSGADLEVMRRDSLKMRGERPFYHGQPPSEGRGRGGGSMGPRAIRITAEDFVIPAEFGEYQLAEHSAGQIGGVHLELVEQQRPDSSSARTYQQVPLRVLPPFHFPASRLARLPDQPHGRSARRRRTPGRDRRRGPARAPW